MVRASKYKLEAPEQILKVTIGFCTDQPTVKVLSFI